MAFQKVISDELTVKEYTTLLSSSVNTPLCHTRTVTLPTSFSMASMMDTKVSSTGSR